MSARKLQKIEMLRGLASSYVFVGHLGIAALGFPGLLLRFGQEAVMCFFLLSGFVIYHASYHSRDPSFRGYFVHRLRRIYPVLIIALIITCLVQVLAGHRRIDGPTLLGNLLLLQDFGEGKPGVWVGTFGGNLPLWSLSYEWWFYLMFFPIYHFVPVRYQLGLVATLSLTGLASYVVVPNQISLFLLYFISWWTGLEFARTYCAGVTPTFVTQRHSLAVLGGFCVVVPVAMIFLMPPPTHWAYGVHPILETRHFWACLLLAVLGLLWSKARWKYFSRVFGIFSFVAPVSYALYAFHYPLCVTSRQIGWLPASRLTELGAIALTFLLAYLVEIRLQRLIVSGSNRLFFKNKTVIPVSSVAQDNRAIAKC